MRFSTFLRDIAIVSLLVAGVVAARADSWTMPKDKEYSSANGEFVFKVQPRRLRDADRQQCRGALSQRQTEQSDQVWQRVLVNRVSSVHAIVSNSGKFVVTFDEWCFVGRNPIVVYGEKGNLVAHLSLADLGLENHPRIARSLSSSWWNKYAIMLFGPAAKSDAAPWRRELEETLFIRLHWGEVLAIDLSSGKLLAEDDRRGLSAPNAKRLAAETNAFLDKTYRRLAKQYLREGNFFNPDPTTEGIQGILLAMQLRLREPLPLLRRVAATERFQGWSAPRWREDV